MEYSEGKAAEKILDYWFALEFLSQDKYPESRDIRNRIKKYKEDVAKNRTRSKTIEDFILLSGTDVEADLYELIRNEACSCDMKKWGNLTFYIGKVKREHCIECISKVLPFDAEDSNRPEKSSDKIAWASLQLSPEGNYVEKSLSLSTILWALDQMKNAKSNLSGALDDAMYANTVEQLEKFFFKKDKMHNMLLSDEIKSENKKDMPAICEKHFEDKNTTPDSDEEIQTFAASAVTLTQLQKLYKEIEKSYIKGNIENDDQEEDAYEEVYGISFQLFKDEATKNKREDDNYLGLNHDYFSNDIKLVLESVKKNDLARDHFLGQDLQKYITVLSGKEDQSKRINVVIPDNNDFGSYRDHMVELMRLKNAPLGKWPSRFMPAYMQQMAINLAIKKGQSALFDVNGKIFSVNGPPGTGKTTLLKEIVVSNIVERAILLSKYDDPEDAFVECDFLHGDKEGNAYSTYTRHWFRLKEDEINNYSMLVTSCNNAAVENISKELPRGLTGDLSPLEGDSKELSAALAEVSGLFDANTSDVVETTYQRKTYLDIYFTKYAQELLESNDVWGLVAAPLGKKSNLNHFYSKVLYPLSRDFYAKRDTAKNRVQKYKEARRRFREQLGIVEKLQEELSRIGDLSAAKATAKSMLLQAKQELELAEREYQEAQKEMTSQIAEIDSALLEAERKYLACSKDLEEVQKRLQAKRAALDEAGAHIKETLREEISERSSVGIFTKIFKKAKYEAAMQLADEYKKDADRQRQMIRDMEQELREMANSEAHAQESVNASKAKLAELIRKKQDADKVIRSKEKEMKTAENRIIDVEKQYKDTVNEYESEVGKYVKASDLDTATMMDDDYIEKLISEDRDASTAAQVENPWFTQRYNREREKLFALAMRMNKEFVVSSNRCRDNFNTLSHYWGFKEGDDKERIKFHKEDKERIVPALYQTLFLLVPVISSTFASIGNLLRDVKNTGTIGMLVVDEAGQAQPQMALGALYRCRRAVIVGDPRQVEPVVTDDLLLLKNAYRDAVLKPYKKKTISVQSFADRLNAFGTYLDNGSDEPEWVGCPLLVHRRCISPMYDISNQLSYNGIMKQQTRPPKPEKAKLFVYEKSQWINLTGKEKGNKNHFVEAQGDKVCELLETAFSKTSEPSLYIISPFTSVVSGIKKHIQDYCRRNKATTKVNPDYILDYDQKRIGTVHTFQGKEADEVIFLLGCDESKDAEGAIRWVNKNIVNVAATRAKYRLYMIGNETAWNKSSCISEAKQIMDTLAIKEM
ncbi:MAG: hypothetical protein HDQ98_03620 [Lachnospiraceae bacterium]|nr:hypothetical protein [Lachnospiraceae bacterium]